MAGEEKKFQGVTVLHGVDGRDTPLSQNFKALCQVEAVRALASHCSPVIATMKPDQVLELLDATFDHIATDRRNFSPQDYAVYFFSIVSKCCVEAADAESIKNGSFAYMREVEDELSDEIAALIPQSSNEPSETIGFAENLRQRDYDRSQSASDVRKRRERLQRSIRRSSRSKFRLVWFILFLATSSVAISLWLFEFGS